MGFAPLGFDAHRTALMGEGERRSRKKCDRSDDQPGERWEAERTGCSNSGNERQQKEETEQRHDDDDDVAHGRSRLQSHQIQDRFGIDGMAPHVASVTAGSVEAAGRSGPWMQHHTASFSRCLGLAHGASVHCVAR